MSYFSELYCAIRYPIDSEAQLGLHNAQIGAIHSIAAHATITPADASIVVMPTGAGKTTVLMLAPYLLQKTKVLIVTPSSMVRGQIVDDYKQLRTLKKIGVFAENVIPPTVFEAEHLYTSDQGDIISTANVVVASAQVAASISDAPIANMFDYVIIDEAHHVPAPTWQHILINMHSIASLLVTATPFRLDKKDIRGTYVYNYPLSKAYKDGIFGAIQFVPIEEHPDKDRLIAVEAERVFQNDRNDGYDHYIMVRTDTQVKARELEVLYAETTQLKLKRIDSSMSFTTVQKTISQLKSRQLDGVICVNMLGEGFDFPNLKIAAIHEPQKSLASTLQFIGRFARTNAENIGTAKFIAMNDDSLRIENQRLYASDSIWQDIIIDISERKISSDIEIFETLNGFSRPDESACAISLHNVRPNCHAKVYKVPDFHVDGVFPELLGVQDSIYRNIGMNTVIGISSYEEAPLWLAGGQTPNKSVNLYIVHYQDKTGLLFIYSQQKSEIVYESIAQRFSSSYIKIPRNKMHRVLAYLANYEFFNTGMQNRFAENGESYRIYVGSNTAQSIDPNSGQMLSAGHAFCKAIHLGQECTIGYSSGSKFWSSQYLSIPEYISWCDAYGEKIANESINVVTHTNYDRLPIPEGIKKYEGAILLCLLPEKVYLSPPIIRLKEDASTRGHITDAEIICNGIVQSGASVAFTVSFGGITEQFHCDTSGHYSSQTNSILCHDGCNSTYLADYFNNNPLQFKTSNDTVYYGQEVTHGNEYVDHYDKECIVALDWRGRNVDTSKEIGTLKNGGVSIQDGLLSYLLEDKCLTHIIFDHGSGEIADFITFSETTSQIHVSLYHCKGFKGKKYNSNVGDVYEVAQQSVKSTVWVKSKSCLLDKIQKRVRSNKKNEFYRGDIKSLKALLKSEKILFATIYIVQPAISYSSSMAETVGEVLAAASFYIKHTGRVDALKIIGSE